MIRSHALLFPLSIASLMWSNACLFAADADAGATPAITQDFLDLALEPPTINTSPGPEYADERRLVNMIIGLDRTPKGRLWACWVSGGDNQDGYFVAATSDDDGATWSKPRLVIDPPDPPGAIKRRVLVGNFWTDPKGRLWLYFDQSMSYFDGRAGVWATRCDNPDDDSPTWSQPKRIWHGCTLNKPTVLRNGQWMLPVSLWPRERIPASLKDAYPELDRYRKAHVFVSSDEGETWTRSGGVLFPGSEFDEHMTVELNDGRLWMLARTNYGGMAESYSCDGGQRWSLPQPSVLRHTSSRFHIRRLASGRLLLVKHGPPGERTQTRSDLTAYLSDDDGKTWKGGLLLDSRAKVSYPDGFQAPDGTIYILYDWNRSTDAEILLAKFREDDILAGRAHTGREVTDARQQGDRRETRTAATLVGKTGWYRREVRSHDDRIRRPLAEPPGLRHDAARARRWLVDFVHPSRR